VKEKRWETISRDEISELRFLAGGLGLKKLECLAKQAIEGPSEENSKRIQSFCSPVAQMMLSCLNNPTMFPDFTFMIQGKPILCHRFILSTTSAYFEALFKVAEGMAQFTFHEPHITYPVFFKCLEFLYTETVEFSDVTEALDVLKLCPTLLLESLRGIVEIHIRSEFSSIDTNNAVQVDALLQAYDGTLSLCFRLTLSSCLPGWSLAPTRFLFDDDGERCQNLYECLSLQQTQSRSLKTLGQKGRSPNPAISSPRQSWTPTSYLINSYLYILFKVCCRSPVQCGYRSG
jgi:hypothetical protein